MAKITTNMPKLGILLGDSITQHSFAPHGWGGYLSNQLQRKVDIISRGYSGYNTRGILHNIEHIFPKNDPQDTPNNADQNNIAFVTIFLGANDAALGGNVQKNIPGDPQHVPLPEFGENLIKISEYITENLKVDKNRQIIIGPPPCDGQAWLETARIKYQVDIEETNRTFETTELYSNKSREIASKLGCRFLDLYENMVTDGWKDYLSDGLHLSDQGNKFLYEILWEQHVKELTEDLPQFLPNWRDLPQN